MEDTQYSLQSVRLIEAGRSGESFGGFVETHTLFFTSNGSGYLYIDGVRHRLKAKAICYCPPGAIIDIWREEAALVLYELQYQVWEMEERSSSRIVYVKRMGELMESGKLPFAASHEAIALAQELHDRWRGDGNDVQKDALFKQLLHISLRPPVQGDDAEEWLVRIRHAVDYIEKHYAQPITRSDMARRTGLTPEHFSVSFKRATGIGFSEQLTRLRIDKAKEALLGSDCNLDRIAREVGYRDGLYLSRKFKQQTGLSPRDYIRRPKRIVSLHYVGHLLALGLKPVGTTTKLLHALPYQGLLDNVVDVGSKLSLDGVAALAPDLIITSKANSEPLANLATTISIPWGREDCLEELLRLGRALNRISEAEQWIASFKEKESRAAAQVAAFVKPGATAAVFEFWSDRIWAVNIGYGRGLRNIYKTFSFKPPEALAVHVLDEGVGLELSIDTIVQHAPDYIFVSVWEENGGVAHARRIMGSSEWKGLPAVRHGRVYPINLALFKYNDPIALEQQLAIQTELLTKVHNKPHFWE